LPPRLYQWKAVCYDISSGREGAHQARFSGAARCGHAKDSFIGRSADYRVFGAFAAAAAWLAAGAGAAEGKAAAPSTTAPAAGATAAEPNMPGPWAVYRGGPSMMGVAPDRLADELKVVWKFKARGAVVSSPIIVANRVFVGSYDANCYCLDLDTGTLVWASKTGGGIEAPPTYVDGTVYVGDTDGLLYALNAADGKRKWKFETDDKILGAANWFRDPKTGKLRVVVGSYDFSLYCIDPDTGKQLWKYTSGNYINGGVAVWKGRTVFGGCDAVVHVVPPDGRDAKEYDAEAYIAATAAIDPNGRVYVGNYDGGFLCLDIVTGKKIWSYGGEEPFFSSPAVGPDKVVVGSRDTLIHCVDRKTGKKVWTFPTKGEINGSPVICGGKVVCGSGDGRLYLLRLADGKLIWSYDCGPGVSSSPAVAGGLVVIGADNGFVYCFGPKE